jgi:hypothetical protein
VTVIGVYLMEGVLQLREFFSFLFLFFASGFSSSYSSKVKLLYFHSFHSRIHAFTHTQKTHQDLQKLYLVSRRWARYSMLNDLGISSAHLQRGMRGVVRNVV